MACSIAQGEQVDHNIEVNMDAHYFLGCGTSRGVVLGCGTSRGNFDAITIADHGYINQVDSSDAEADLKKYLRETYEITVGEDELQQAQRVMEQQLDAMAEKIMKRPEEEKEAQMSEWLLSRIEIEDADFEAKTLQIRCLEASLEVYAQCNSVSLTSKEAIKLVIVEVLILQKSGLLCTFPGLIDKAAKDQPRVAEIDDACSFMLITAVQVVIILGMILLLVLARNRNDDARDIVRTLMICFYAIAAFYGTWANNIIWARDLMQRDPDKYTPLVLFGLFFKACMDEDYPGTKLVWNSIAGAFNISSLYFAVTAVRGTTYDLDSWGFIILKILEIILWLTFSMFGATSVALPVFLGVYYNNIIEHARNQHDLDLGGIILGSVYLLLALHASYASVMYIYQLTSTDYYEQRFHGDNAMFKKNDETGGQPTEQEQGDQPTEQEQGDQPTEQEQGDQPTEQPDKGQLFFGVELPPLPKPDSSEGGEHILDYLEQLKQTQMDATRHEIENLYKIKAKNMSHHKRSWINTTPGSKGQRKTILAIHHHVWSDSWKLGKCAVSLFYDAVILNFTIACWIAFYQFYGRKNSSPYDKDPELSFMVMTLLAIPTMMGVNIMLGSGPWAVLLAYYEFMPVPV